MIAAETAASLPTSASTPEETSQAAPESNPRTPAAKARIALIGTCGRSEMYIRAIFGEHAGVAALPGADVVSGSVDQDATLDGAAPVVFSTTAANVLAHPDELLEECFGPATLLIEYRDADELSAVLAKVPGSLAATVHAQPGEDISGLV